MLKLINALDFSLERTLSLLCLHYLLPNNRSQQCPLLHMSLPQLVTASRQTIKWWLSTATHSLGWSLSYSFKSDHTENTPSRVDYQLLAQWQSSHLLCDNLAMAASFSYHVTVWIPGYVWWKCKWATLLTSMTFIQILLLCYLTSQLIHYQSSQTKRMTQQTMFSNTFANILISAN
jgi:hypothetical protein